jgi:hypothetical protein
MAAPPIKPMLVESKPPRLYASSMRSKASAEISTPPPNAITPAIIFRGTLAKKPTPAPTINAAPAISPHSPACSQIGNPVIRLRPFSNAPAGLQRGHSIKVNGLNHPPHRNMFHSGPFFYWGDRSILSSPRRMPGMRDQFLYCGGGRRKNSPAIITYTARSRAPSNQLLSPSALIWARSSTDMITATISGRLN